MLEQYDEVYRELTERIEELRAQAQTKAGHYFKGAVVDLFLKHPMLESICWQQYTPYFNDGDPCTFRAYIDYPYLKFSDREERLGGDEIEYSDELKEGPERDCLRDVLTFLRAIKREHYQWMFGDHVEITVDRQGITVEEYSQHD